jgi:predicted dehydrogenase
MRIGLIGYGYWGPNIAKNLHKLNVDFTVIVDSDHSKLSKLSYPKTILLNNINDALNHADAFIIATPIETHYSIAKYLLENNKHVLIQKPMADSSDKCKELIDLSYKNNLTLMVAHTFLFSPPINKIKEDINNNNYGDLNYIISTRINLGLFQRHHNVIWDLAPHDFSIIRYLYNEKPIAISAVGKKHTECQHIDCASISILYSSNFMATINVNWLSPIKVRNMIIGGQDKTVLYDDCSLDKIKIYDSGVEFNNDVFTYRKGDINIPRLDEKEPINYECIEFINSIEKNKRSVSDGEFGLEVVKMIEAANKSILNNSAVIPI